MPSEFDLSLHTLRRGGLLAWPTDTTWGLLARADRPETLARIYRVKGRDPAKPLQLLVADLPAARRLLDPGWDAAAFERLARAFWPGALTLVVPAGAEAPEACVHEGKVGLRLPADRELRELLAGVGGYAAATSLNPSGRPPVLRYRDALRYADWVDRIHPGEAGGTEASTVVDLTEPRILREGSVPAADVRRLLEGA
ncbi:L-threonylcarbamoyladenylate synthase [Oceanithermus sp.]